MTFTQQSQPSPHQSHSFYIAKNVKINNINILNVLNTSVITVTNKHQCTGCLIVQSIEVGDFNHSGGYCYELFFSSNMCILCICFPFFISFQHVSTCRTTCVLLMFTMLLPSVLHVFALRLTHVSYIFKPVVR